MRHYRVSQGQFAQDFFSFFILTFASCWCAYFIRKIEFVLMIPGLEAILITPETR